MCPPPPPAGTSPPAQYSTVQYSTVPALLHSLATLVVRTPLAGHLQPRVAVQARSAGAGLAYPPPPLGQRGVVLAGTCGHPPHTAAMITLSLTVIPRAVAQRGQLRAGGLLGGGHDGVDDAGS